MKATIIPVDTQIYKKYTEDTATPIAKRMLNQAGFQVEMVQPLPNDREVLRKVLEKVADSGIADLVLTIGGIGCRAEDWTPEATRAVVDKEIPGIGEAMRLYMTRTRKRSMLIRCTAGIRRDTLIVNLPGNPKAMKECLEYVMPELVYCVEVVLGEHDDIKE